MINNLFKMLCIAAVAQCCVVNGMNPANHRPNILSEVLDDNDFPIERTVEHNIESFFLKAPRNLFDFIQETIKLYAVQEEMYNLEVDKNVYYILYETKVSEHILCSLADDVYDFITNPTDENAEKKLDTDYNIFIKNALQILPEDSILRRDKTIRQHTFFWLIKGYNVYKAKAKVLLHNYWFNVFIRAPERRYLYIEKKEIDLAPRISDLIANDDYIEIDMTIDKKFRDKTIRYRIGVVENIMRWVYDINFESRPSAARYAELMDYLFSLKDLFRILNVSSFKQDLDRILCNNQFEMAASFIAVGAVSQIEVEKIDIWFREMTKYFYFPKNMDMKNIMLFGVRVANYLLDLIVDKYEQNWFVRRWIQYYSRWLKTKSTISNRYDIQFKNMFSKDANQREKAWNDYFAASQYPFL